MKLYNHCVIPFGLRKGKTGVKKNHLLVVWPVAGGRVGDQA